MYRVKHSIAILASLDTEERFVGFERANATSIQTIRADPAEGKAETRIVAKNTTDQDLEFGGVTTASILYIETDQELSIKLNGGAESFKLVPTSGANAKLLWEGEFTQIQVTNPSSDNDAIVTYMLAGS
jgi:hypothetical protein